MTQQITATIDKFFNNKSLCTSIPNTPIHLYTYIVFL